MANQFVPVVIKGKRHRYVGGSELEKRYPDLQPNKTYFAVGVDTHNIIVQLPDDIIPVPTKFFDIPELRGSNTYVEV